jgi:hypothetical protein
MTVVATMSMIWILYFLLAAITMLVLVPQRQIVRLLPFGIVGGAVIAAVIQAIAVWYLRLWRFNHTQLAAYQGIPIFLVLSWLPLTIVFGNWLLSLHSGTARFFYIAAFAIATVGIEYILLRTGFMVHRNWSILRTAVLAVGLHYLLAWYLLAVRPRDEDRKVIRMER